MNALALAALLPTAALAGAPASPVPAKPAVKTSAAAAAPATAALALSTQTVSTLYTGDRVRDPFLPTTAGAGPQIKRLAPGELPPPLDIHALSLRGILKDRRSEFALLSAQTGGTYLLRGNRLYDERNKPVPGVRGRIMMKQKTVQLMTADKDIQIYRLGVEEDKDQAGGASTGRAQ